MWMPALCNALCLWAVNRRRIPQRHLYRFWLMTLKIFYSRTGMFPAQKFIGQISHFHSPQKLGLKLKLKLIFLLHLPYGQTQTAGLCFFFLPFSLQLVTTKDTSSIHTWINIEVLHLPQQTLSTNKHVVL